MLGRTYAGIMVFSVALGAQNVWTGIPPLDRKPLLEARNATTSLVLIPVESQNVGELDGGVPIRTAIQVMNVGTRTFKVLAPAPGGISRIRVQFPVSGDLEVAPGEVFRIPVEYDARMEAGPIVFEVAFRSSDPAARVLRQSFQAVVTRALEVRPYRDCIQGQLDAPGSSKALPISFLSEGVAGFRDITIENEAAPLLVTGTLTPSGDWVGSITLDWPRIQSGACPRRGETRVLATTFSGRHTYTWIQWLVQ